MKDIKYNMIRLLNKFCFNKRHDHECCGCIFKPFKKCPLNTVVNILEK